jgi:hypothetical protein
MGDDNASKTNEVHELENWRIRIRQVSHTQRQRHAERQRQRDRDREAESARVSFRKRGGRTSGRIGGDGW